MQSKLRNLTISSICIGAFIAASAAAHAGTVLRVHLQGSPNVYAVRVTFLNSNGPYGASRTITPAGTYDWFLPNDTYVIVVFNQDTRKLIATQQFAVTDNNPPTTAARIFQDMNNQLQLYWGYVGTQSYEEAVGGAQTSERPAKAN